MLKQLFTLVFFFLSAALMAQSVNYQYADTFYFKSKTGKTEIVYKNRTDTTPGFLFNAGDGRLIFKRALKQIGENLYLIGADTLRLTAPSSSGTNGDRK